ncbi:MAG: cobyrinate a,c-diamide synthase [Chloroflexi bacterium]|nr:cobyrinate a,c-diamide synthase [Chloroflexota bacterium]
MDMGDDKMRTLETTNIPRLVIAAPSSGSGKSTITAGLMAALAQERVVQGFKVGPDYIDPMYHTAATGRPSRNLDTWMVARQQVVRLFGRASAGANVAVIEGVMGLFDGYGATDESGSTAEVAKLLGAPVILVVDVGKMARSAGAIAMGYRDFDPALRLAGVICNNVAGARHAQWVIQAVESIGLPVLGCVPRSADLKIPERHLGLLTAVERQTEVDVFIRRAAEMMASHLDLDRVWAIARDVKTLEIAPAQYPDGMDSPHAHQSVRIAVARDEAFCFYYEDNLDLLRTAGAEIVFFNPLRDTMLPEGVHGIYLGGGYPELYAAQLAQNKPVLDAIRAAHKAGMPIYAECGGLMALVERLVDLSGQVHWMAGVIPGMARMQRRLTMGYRLVTARRDTPLLRAGEQTRGHEFHYSDWDSSGFDPADYAYEIAPREGHEGDERRLEGVARSHLLASYVHLHFAAYPAMATRFVEACANFG